MSKTWYCSGCRKHHRIDRWIEDVRNGADKWCAHALRLEAKAAREHNRAPVCAWFREDWGAHERHRLHVDGRETPYFVDVARSAAHRTNGHRVALFGSGMHDTGCARFLQGFTRIADAKRAAERHAESV